MNSDRCERAKGIPCEIRFTYFEDVYSRYFEIGDRHGSKIDVELDESTDKFSFALPSQLRVYDTVDVFQSSPVQSPSPTTGKIEIAAAPPRRTLATKGRSRA